MTSCIPSFVVYGIFVLEIAHTHEIITDTEMEDIVSFASEPNAEMGELTEQQMVSLCTMKDCTSYDCFHRAARCNTTHYLVTKGKPTCEKLWKAENLRLFNREGQAWMRCWNKCQIEYVTKYFEKYSPVQCEFLSSALSESAIDCHVSCGFCAICKDSRIAMLKMLKHRSLSLLKRDSDFRGAIKRCGGPSACALPLT